jgi:hypothetical protein
MIERRYLVLRGPMERQSIVLCNRYPFVDGRLVLEVQNEEFENVAKYLKRCYQAQEVDLGQFQAYLGTVPGPVSEVESGVRPLGSSPSESASDEGTRPTETRTRDKRFSTPKRGQFRPKPKEVMNESVERFGRKDAEPLDSDQDISESQEDAEASE